MKPFHTYEISVPGFDPVLYSARRPAQAMARCWRDYGIVDDCCSYKEFLGKARLRSVDHPPGVGDRILVAGAPATRCVAVGNQYVQFMRDDSDVILSSHPSDVTPLPPDQDPLRLIPQPLRRRRLSASQWAILRQAAADGDPQVRVGGTYRRSARALIRAGLLQGDLAVTVVTITSAGCEAARRELALLNAELAAPLPEPRP